MTVEEKNQMRGRMRDILGGAGAAFLFAACAGGLGHIASLVLAVAMFVASYAHDN